VERKNVFFRGLNELRATAAFSVVFHHVESYKHREGHFSLYDTPLRGFIENLGYNAVWLFFVLSGFLITYLLLVEQNETGTIRVVDFYLRRALRIWPLYFLIVVLAFFVLPLLPGIVPGLADDPHVTACLASLSTDFGKGLLLFALFLPNLALVLFGPVAGATQAWSIGSEEQFYLVWPLIVRLFRRVLPRTMLILIFLKILLLIVVMLFSEMYDIQWLAVLGKFLLTLRLELMAIGALAAYALVNFEQETKSIAGNRWLQISACGMMMALLNWNNGASYLVLGIVFAFIIVSVTVENGIPCSSKILDRLGRISYGIYMYHPLIIILVFSMCRSLQITNQVAYNLAIYFGVFSTTTLVSFLSYRFFEQFFLRQKTRFAAVLGTDRN